MKNVTADANSIDGIHVDTSSNNVTLQNDTAIGNLHDGAYLASLVTQVSGSTFNLNHNLGIDLEQPGAVLVQGNTVSSNTAGGIYITNSSGAALVGSTNLALNAGNVVTGNGGSGIQAYGTVTVAGNSVSGQAAFNAAGIYLASGATAADNLVFNNYFGINTGGAVITNNRVYHNSSVGINSTGGTISGNVVYSNGVGIETYSTTVQNNLIYANTSEGIQITYGNVALNNNTIYQLTGDAVNVAANVSNLQLLDNILWVAAGYDLDIPATSQNGFTSDFNLLYTTGSGSIGSWQGVCAAPCRPGNPPRWTIRTAFRSILSS